MTDQEYKEWKRARVRAFFTALSQDPKRFTEPYSAHTYLVATLEETEKANGAYGSHMVLPAFLLFTLDPKYELYHHGCVKEVVLIHNNGAYAFYKNTSDDDFTVEPMAYYKRTPQLCLMSVPNAYGNTVWSK